MVILLCSTIFSNQKKHFMKQLILMLAAVIFIHQANAQTKLKITRAKKETYSSYTQAWSGWPGSYTYFSEGSRPVILINRLDDQGSDFSLDVWVNGTHSNFTVSYKGYDSKNNWYRYSDNYGDEICVLGSTLSSLAQYGWPQELTQIYLWIYSQNYALVLE